MEHTEPRRLAVIGTAGRDKTKPMTKDLWEKMLIDAHYARILASDHLISGGAAWADHVAVVAYLNDWCAALTLHLPAPFIISDDKCWFDVFPSGPSAGNAANHYHRLFSVAIGHDTLGDIAAAIKKGAVITQEPVQSGYTAMFARNAKVAKDANSVLSYTFGPGDTPRDGGTLHTWYLIKSQNRTHVSLLDFI